MDTYVAVFIICYQNIFNPILKQLLLLFEKKKISYFCNQGKSQCHGSESQ